ncbi:MAG: hypothetical protein QNJ31_08175 [Candidatus Caenarcaniphilales bacterium]|nr:hypothetical protein [Candidatus Caenarcaniphilales bacterium]
MSLDKNADSQKKLELATNIVVAYINSFKSSEKASKTTSNSSISEDEILGVLERTFNKMHDLVPYKEKKVGLGH